MAKISDRLVDCSLQAALASIEIYNKPCFNYREQVFVILIVNAWELMLKAKIILDGSEIMDSIYATDNKGKQKHSRTGNVLTIDMKSAMNKLDIPVAVSENLTSLLDIRDTAVHFINDDTLSYLVFTLGVAALKNYQRLIKNWFGRSLKDYNLQILPLAFDYNFKTISLLELDKQPESIANLFKSVSSVQSSIDQQSGFHFVCEVITEIKSAKKFTEDKPDLFTNIAANTIDNNATIVFKTQRLIDLYPFSCSELVARVREAKHGIKLTQIYKTIRDHHIKMNPKYSTYIFKYKTQEEIYKTTGELPQGLSCIYNEDAVRFIIQNVEL